MAAEGRRRGCHLRRSGLLRRAYALTGCVLLCRLSRGRLLGHRHDVVGRRFGERNLLRHRCGVLIRQMTITPQGGRAAVLAAQPSAQSGNVHSTFNALLGEQMPQILMGDALPSDNFGEPELPDGKNIRFEGMANELAVNPQAGEICPMERSELDLPKASFAKRRNLSLLVSLSCKQSQIGNRLSAL